MTTRALLMLLAVGAVLGAGYVHADTYDDLYVESLHQVGISAGSGDTGLIIAGHLVCAAFGAGQSFNDAKTLLLVNNPKLDATGAAQIIGSATAAYCPAFGWKFGSVLPAGALA